jgi:hypothetical protein
LFVSETFRLSRQIEVDTDRVDRVNTLGAQLVERKNNKYPLHWLQIYDELQQRADNGVNYAVLGLGPEIGLPGVGTASSERGVYPIARAHGVRTDSEEYLSVCVFLEEAGSFVRFRDLLILRPQWIADTLFAVVTRPQFNYKPSGKAVSDDLGAQQELEVRATSDSTEMEQQWRNFERGAVVGEQLLAQLWSAGEEDPQLLTELMVHFDLMLELPPVQIVLATTNHDPTPQRIFLVPSILPVVGRSVHTDLQPPITGSEPACYLVFGQKSSDGSDEPQDVASHAFIPEWLWFKLIVRCARWSQHTNSQWCAQHLTKNVRRDRARFSIGSQHFELRLHRAEHSIRLLVLGGEEQYPFEVLRRLRDIVDATLEEFFPRLEYFVALRLSASDDSENAMGELLHLDSAIGHISRREFGSADIVHGRKAFRSRGGSGLVAVSRIDIDRIDAHPWCPSKEQHVQYDIYLSHAEADTEFALKLYDCIRKCVTPSGEKAKVFLRGVTLSHVKGAVTPHYALGASTLFVPIVSARALAACSGKPRKRCRPWQLYAVWIFRLGALLLTVIQFIAHLLLLNNLSVQSGWRWPLFGAAMLVPRLLNVFLLGRLVTVELNDNHAFEVWLRQHRAPFSAIFALSILRLDNFSMLTSSMFDMSICRAPVPVKACDRISAWGLAQNMLGDIPQLVVAWTIDNWTDMIVLGTVASNIFCLLFQISDRVLACMLLRAGEEPILPVQVPSAIEHELLFDWMLATELTDRDRTTSTHINNEGVTAPLLSVMEDRESLEAATAAADDALALLSVPRSILPLVIDDSGNRNAGDGVPVPSQVLQMLDSAWACFPHLGRSGEGGEEETRAPSRRHVTTVGGVIGAVLQRCQVRLGPVSSHRHGRSDENVSSHRHGSLNEWRKYETAAHRIVSALPF